MTKHDKVWASLNFATGDNVMQAIYLLFLTLFVPGNLLAADMSYDSFAQSIGPTTSAEDVIDAVKANVVSTPEQFSEVLQLWKVQHLHNEYSFAFNSATVVRMWDVSRPETHEQIMVAEGKLASISLIKRYATVETNLSAQDLLDVMHRAKLNFRENAFLYRSNVIPPTWGGVDFELIGTPVSDKYMQVLNESLRVYETLLTKGASKLQLEQASELLGIGRFRVIEVHITHRVRRATSYCRAFFQ